MTNNNINNTNGCNTIRNSNGCQGAALKKGTGIFMRVR